MKTDICNKGDYPHIEKLPTRWADNDMYGHVNNVVYYAYFDTVVNRLLINQGWLNPLEDKEIAVVAETQCQFFNSVAYPEILDVGLLVERVGNSSVTYRLGVFSQDRLEPAAQGRFVHVYVDKVTRQPVSIPPAVRQGLLALTVTS
ncbi:thioesterase family protein [Paraglaciecola sp.]|uniref:acyl-CoA thioesterase n=1 Tax=Paraglaciecola sp. TaxID=1920173 RepID=UPI0030F4A99B